MSPYSSAACRIKRSGFSRIVTNPKPLHVSLQKTLIEESFARGQRRQGWPAKRADFTFTTFTSPRAAALAAALDHCGRSNDRSNGFGPTPWIV